MKFIFLTFPGINLNNFIQTQVCYFVGKLNIGNKGCQFPNRELQLQIQIDHWKQDDIYHYHYKNNLTAPEKVI